MLSVIEKIVFVAAVALAVALALGEFLRKFKLISSGRKVARLDQPGRRIGAMLRKVLLQTPVFAQRPVTGFFHAVIFWGFLVFLGV
ncbi:MAG TPA: hypothetical protein VLQ89_06385, partial [Candidatus Binatia bacterium]|nr:hypothetical protein [Candidatus Binatia bacterium]